MDSEHTAIKQKIIAALKEWRDGFLATRRPENAAFRLDWIEYKKLEEETGKLLNLFDEREEL